MKKLLLPFGLFFIIAMIIFPQESYAAAQNGLALWWEVVLPALLPFFIAAELLMSAGAAHDLGYLLAPVMRPVFRLPGEAALALVMGYSSGFPTGAAVTASLREKNLVTREEGERLISFTNNASPLFISISVATGILGQAQLGLTLMLIHYSSNLLIGFILRWRAPKEYATCRPKGILMDTTQRLPLGTVLKNAARKAGGNIAIIGCYMVFFSVLTQILVSCGIISLLEPLFNIDHHIFRALSMGLWEMTIGLNAVGDSLLALNIKLPIAAALLAWGGFSVQAQVSAMVSHTDIKIKTYVLCRVAQALLSLLIAGLVCYFWPLSSTAISTGTFPAQTPVVPVIYSLILLLPLVVATIVGRTLRFSRH